jgi:opacity protein-like surface antigen
LGSDDLYGQARVGVNFTHRFSERLRFSSRNFISYELEPDYAYGFATARQLGEYLYWTTDNSVGYRWTERFATYTGFSLTGLDYDEEVSSQDRFTWTLYNQFRYQLSPQTVLTADYRYAQTDGDDLASDYTDHYLLGGVEHRFSPNTIMIARVGAQFHESDGIGASDSTSPYVEATMRSQVNQQFMIRGFVRYGIEGYDTVRTIAFPGTPTTIGTYEFDERQTLRLGLSGEYTLSQMVSLFGGLDYIPATFDDGRQVIPGPAPLTAGGFDEDIWNAYIGLSFKFTEMLYGTLSYNYTDSESDFPDQSYNRQRVSVGLRAEF